MILRPYGGACYLYIGIGWPGLKKMGVEISEVLNLAIVRIPFINDLILEGSKEKQINIDNIPIQKVIESQQGVIDLKQKSLSYRLYLAKINGLKVPVKRVEMSNKINLFKKQDIKIKNDMQKASKDLFIANYKDNVLNIGNFRTGMKMYLRKVKILKLILRIFVIAFSEIKKSIQKS